MSLFTKYKNIEAEVTGIVMSNANLGTIIDCLSVEVKRGAIAEMTIGIDADNNYQIVYRYNTSTQAYTLSAGMYLVKLNNGEYVVYTPEVFNARYIHTALDTTVQPGEEKTPKKALLDFIVKFFPDAGVTSEADLTAEKLAPLADHLNIWYDPATDYFDIKFTDCGIVSPAGIADILNIFPTPSAVKDTTHFSLNFSNGAYHEGDSNTTPNSFNAIALQELIGELCRVNGAKLNKLSKIYFHAAKSDSPSAVAASVTDAQWSSFCSKVKNITAVAQYSDITR